MIIIIINIVFFVYLKWSTLPHDALLVLRGLNIELKSLLLPSAAGWLYYQSLKTTRAQDDVMLKVCWLKHSKQYLC